MATAFDVANFFIEMANSEEEGAITNLKLNKLMYYAQGCFLARTGRRLFDEDIVAWQYGPAIPVVYRKYHVCGRNPIQVADEDYDASVFSDEEMEAMLDVLRERGIYTAAALVERTHRVGTPWQKTEQRHTISDELIKDYFQTPAHEIPRFKVDSSDAVDKLPADWYDEAEDTYWDS